MTLVDRVAETIKAMAKRQELKILCNVVKRYQARPCCSWCSHL